MKIIKKTHATHNIKSLRFSHTSRDSSGNGMGVVWEWGSHYCRYLEFLLKSRNKTCSVAAMSLAPNLSKAIQYCWFKKSCTAWDAKKTAHTGINYLSTGAGFLPSTVRLESPNMPTAPIVSFSPHELYLLAPGRMRNSLNLPYRIHLGSNISVPSWERIHIPPMEEEHDFPSYL